MGTKNADERVSFIFQERKQCDFVLIPASFPCIQYVVEAKITA